MVQHVHIGFVGEAGIGGHDHLFSINIISDAKPTVTLQNCFYNWGSGRRYRTVIVSDNRWRGHTKNAEVNMEDIEAMLEMVFSSNAVNT